MYSLHTWANLPSAWYLLTCWNGIWTETNFNLKLKKQGTVPLKAPSVALILDSTTCPEFTPVVSPTCTLAPPHVQATGWYSKGTTVWDCETEWTSWHLVLSPNIPKTRNIPLLWCGRARCRRLTGPVVFQKAFSSPWLMSVSRCRGQGLKMARG